MQRRGISGSRNETKQKKTLIDHQKETTEAPSSPRNPQPTVDSYVVDKGLRTGKSAGAFVSTNPEDYCKNYAFENDDEPSNLYENPLSESPDPDPPIDSTTTQLSSSTNTGRVTRSRTKMMKDREIVLPSVSRCESPSSTSLSSQTSSTDSKSTNPLSNKDTKAMSRKCKSSDRLAAQIGARLAKSQISPTSTSSSSNTKSTKSKSSPAKVKTSSGAKSTTSPSSSKGKSITSQGSPKSIKSYRNPKVPTGASSQAGSVKVIETQPSSSPQSETVRLQTVPGIVTRRRAISILSSNSGAADADDHKIEEGNKHGYENPLDNIPDTPTEKSIVDRIILADEGKPVSV